MKLFIIAALVAVCAAGRLEHLERSYLPPDSSNSLGFGSSRSQNGFGSNGQGNQGFGSYSSSDNFGSNGGSHSTFSSNGGSDAGFGSNGNGFDAATSNQYLPPNYSSAGSNGFARSGSSLRAPGTQYGSPSFGNNNGFGAQGGSQYAQGRTQSGGAGLSNQYLAPTRSNSFQNIPQQNFDEQTGYHY